MVTTKEVTRTVGSLNVTLKLNFDLIDQGLNLFIISFCLFPKWRLILSIRQGFPRKQKKNHDCFILQLFMVYLEIDMNNKFTFAWNIDMYIIAVYYYNLLHQKKLFYFFLNFFDWTFQKSNICDIIEVLKYLFGIEFKLFFGVEQLFQVFLGGIICSSTYKSISIWLSQCTKTQSWQSESKITIKCYKDNSKLDKP